MKCSFKELLSTAACLGTLTGSGITHKVIRKYRTNWQETLQDMQTKIHHIFFTIVASYQKEISQKKPMTMLTLNLHAEEISCDCS